MKKFICLICCMAMILGMISCSSPAVSTAPQSTDGEAPISGTNSKTTEKTTDKTTEEEILGVWEEKELDVPAVSDVTLNEVSVDIDTLTLHTTPINVDIATLKASLEQNSFIRDNYILGEEWSETAAEVKNKGFNYEYEYKVSGQFKEGYQQETDRYFSDFIITLYYNPLRYTNQYRVDVAFNGAPLCASTQQNHLSVLKLVLGDVLAEYLVYGKDSDGLRDAGTVYQASCEEFGMSEKLSNSVATYTVDREMQPYHYENHKLVVYSFGVSKLSTPEPSRYVVYNGDYKSIYLKFPQKVDSVLSSSTQVSDPFSEEFMGLCNKVTESNSFDSYYGNDTLYQLRLFKSDDGYDIYEANFNTERFELGYSLSLKSGNICGATYFSSAYSGTINSGGREDVYNTLSSAISLLINESFGFEKPEYFELVLDEDGNSQVIEKTASLYGLSGKAEIEFHLFGDNGNYKMWIRA